MAKEVLDIEAIKSYLTKFADARNWKQFHSPKNLSMAINVETAELVEIFQWLTEDQSIKIKDDHEKKEAVSDELADIFLYSIRLAEMLDINLVEAIERKKKKNEAKYPLEHSKKIAEKISKY